MILYFKTHTHIYTDKQHFDIKQASMIVQEKWQIMVRQAAPHCIVLLDKPNLFLLTLNCQSN